MGGILRHVASRAERVNVSKHSLLKRKGVTFSQLKLARMPIFWGLGAPTIEPAPGQGENPNDGWF